MALHLLDLPAEIRLKIWEYVTNPDLICQVGPSFQKQLENISTTPHSLSWSKGQKITSAIKRFNTWRILPSWAGATRSNKLMSVEVKACIPQEIKSRTFVVTLDRDMTQEAPEQLSKHYDVAFPQSLDIPHDDSIEIWDNLHFMVFKMNNEAQLLLTEEFQWPYNKIRGGENLIFLRKGRLTRWEYRAGGDKHRYAWRFRREVPVSERHSHIFSKLGLSFESDIHTRHDRISLNAGYRTVRQWRYLTAYISDELRPDAERQDVEAE